MRLAAAVARRRGALAPACALILFFVTSCRASAAGEGASARSRADVVLEWSEKAYDIGFAEDRFETFKGARAQAMMHIAQHDALNAIVPVFAPYAFRGAAAGADPVAAAAQAARDVLVSQYPSQRASADALLDRQLSRVPDGAARKAGIALGKRSAAAILAARARDGHDLQGTYAFDDEPGDYRTTPPFDGFVLQPGFRFARPFAISSPGQFRPPPPPALDSAEYAAAYQEVRNFGRADSRVRTRDQTAYAVWWMEFGEGSMNRLARVLVRRTGTDLWRAARLFAQLNMGRFDAYVATWDSKFEYNHWRPYTAIRGAGRGGRSSPDPTWEALRTTPPFPEYVSAHSAACGNNFAILAAQFGDHTRFEMDSMTAPPGMPTRRFESFTAAAAECADSRVRLGFHFRYSTDRGLKLGRDVARHLVANHLLRRR